MFVDVVMLSNTADRRIYEMTREAITTMRESDPDHFFRVVLVETQHPNFMAEQGFDYEDICTPIYPKAVNADKKFNYNEFLNLGLQLNNNQSQHVVIANNDLVFHEHWFTNLAREMHRYTLDVASPFAPGWPPHEAMPKAPDLLFGTRTSYEVCGWCWCFRKSSLELILPLDVRFNFEFQDVDIVQQLLAQGHGRMALVRSAKVTHLLNQSHHLLEDKEGMIAGAADTYREKYGK